MGSGTGPISTIRGMCLRLGFDFIVSIISKVLSKGRCRPRMSEVGSAGPTSVPAVPGQIIQQVFARSKRMDIYILTALLECLL